jgi:type II secretory pathway component PulF
MQSVAAHVKQGGSLADAVKAQGNYFPDHFAEMIEAGEKTGRLDRVLDRLAIYYQDLADFRSLFLNSILWPMVQLILAIIVVGLLIYLPSVIQPGSEIDLLGFGLTGSDGLVRYATIIGCAAAVVFVLYLIARNGYFNFLGDWVSHLPRLGKTFAVFPEARFVQTLSLAIEAGMDAWSAVDLSFRSAGTPRFLRRAAAAKDAVLKGRDMHTVLAETGLFQDETLEAVQVGEESGRLAETLDKHFRQLKSQVKSSMAKLTYMASGIIWFVIAAALITIIFRVFSLYVNNIGEAAEQGIRQAVK